MSFYYFYPLRVGGRVGQILNGLIHYFFHDMTEILEFLCVFMCNVHHSIMFQIQLDVSTITGR